MPDHMSTVLLGKFSSVVLRSHALPCVPGGGGGHVLSRAPSLLSCKSTQAEPRCLPITCFLAPGPRLGLRKGWGALACPVIPALAGSVPTFPAEDSERPGPAGQVQPPAGKSGALSSHAETHVLEGEKTAFWKLSSDLHMSAMVCT